VSNLFTLELRTGKNLEKDGWMLVDGVLVLVREERLKEGSSRMSLLWRNV
jgi:hypothetical protein